MYIDLNSNRLEYDDGYCESGFCGDVEACGDINASTNVYAAFYANDAIPVATDGEWEMWKPTTFETCKELAGGARWCFANGDGRWFDTYINRGPLYIFVNKNTGEKYASHPETKSWFFDADDRNRGKEVFISFLDEHPNFADALSRDGYDYFYVSKSAAPGEKFTPRFASDFDDGDINASTNINAAVKSKYDSVRKLLGEDEWYYIEEYILNGDGKHSLEDIIFDENAWDDYCDWKMKNFGKKAALSAATRIMAKKILASTRI